MVLVFFRDNTENLRWTKSVLPVIEVTTLKLMQRWNN